MVVSCFYVIVLVMLTETETKVWKLPSGSDVVPCIEDVMMESDIPQQVTFQCFQ